MKFPAFDITGDGVLNRDDLLALAQDEQFTDPLLDVAAYGIAQSKTEADDAAIAASADLFGRLNTKIVAAKAGEIDVDSYVDAASNLLKQINAKIDPTTSSRAGIATAFLSAGIAFIDSIKARDGIDGGEIIAGISGFTAPLINYFLGSRLGVGV